MSFQLVLLFIVGLVMAAALGSTFMKVTAQRFSENPAESTYKGEATRQKISEKAEATAERQRRMMETMKNRMERNKF